MEDVASTTAATTEAVAACLDAYRACRTAAAEDDIQAGHRRLLDDCAEMTLLAAGFFTRRSPHRDDVARLCATISRACSNGLTADGRTEGAVRVAYAACERVHRVCTEWGTETDDDASDARSDARDEALKETFPASDPTPTPTEL